MTVTAFATAEHRDSTLASSPAELVRAARSGLGAARSTGCALLPDDEVAALITELTGLAAQASAWRDGLLAEADRRALAGRAADTSTSAWAARLTSEDGAALHGGLRLARLLEERYHATRDAYAVGDLGSAHARVIADACEKSPPEASAAQIAAGEEWLVGQATGRGRADRRGLSPRRLRHAARRMFGPIDPELAAHHAAILLGRERREADRETWMVLGDNGDGTWSGRFTIPELHGHLLRAGLDRLTTPRRRIPQGSGAGSSTEDPSAPGHLNSSERRGIALVELIEHLPETGYEASNGATLLITMQLDALRDGIGAAGLGGEAQITASEARRLACEAGIVPAVLGGGSKPLDLGRARRLHSPDQRKALALRHEGCAVGGCDRPFAWCEIHHPRWWSRGGRTDLDNSLPLCGFHHRRAHDPEFDLRRHSSGEWRFHRRE